MPGLTRPSHFLQILSPYCNRKERTLSLKGEDAMRTWKKYSLVVAIMVVVLAGLSSLSDARVDVNIGINLPAYTFAAPPSLAVIPGTYVYFVPGIDVDVLFYHGYWYRPYEGRWFRSSSYMGPWGFVAIGRVPHVLIDLPPDFRRIPPGYRLIPYREFGRNWRKWERDRYWERDEWWRGGRHEGMRDERRERGREERREERHEEHGDR